MIPRLVVIGNRMLWRERYTRTNDFRASGSGIKAYDKDLFDPQFHQDRLLNTTRKLGAQSVASMIYLGRRCSQESLEISYCFIMGSHFMMIGPGYMGQRPGMA
jgi:hypothetical protein